MTPPARHPWKPNSPCGSGCVREVPAVGAYRVAWRLIRAGCVLLLGACLGGVLPVLPARIGRPLVQTWYRALLRAFDVRLIVRGRPPGSGGSLVVSNHVSWLDIVALQAVRPMRLLAKREVRSWPVVGSLAARAGTLFIDRDRLRPLPEAVRTVTDALREGWVVGAFPEGTTWCGLASGRYRPAVFQAAIDAGVDVRPVALRFRTGDGGRTTAAAFVGETTLVESMLAVARARDLVLEMFLLPASAPGPSTDRRALARRVAEEITQVAVPAAAGSDPRVKTEHRPDRCSGSPDLRVRQATAAK